MFFGIVYGNWLETSFLDLREQKMEIWQVISCLLNLVSERELLSATAQVADPGFNPVIILPLPVKMGLDIDKQVDVGNTCLEDKKSSQACYMDEDYLLHNKVGSWESMNLEIQCMVTNKTCFISYFTDILIAFDTVDHSLFS